MQVSLYAMRQRVHNAGVDEEVRGVLDVAGIEEGRVTEGHGVHGELGVGVVAGEAGKTRHLCAGAGRRRHGEDGHIDLGRDALRGLAHAVENLVGVRNVGVLDEQRRTLHGVN